MFKKIFFILLICTITLDLYAQNGVDRFNDYVEMNGKEVKFYNAISMSEFQGYYAYELVNGKPILLKDKYIYSLLENNNLIVDGIEVYKKKNFLKVLVAGKKLYLILDKGFSYIDNIRSVEYWKNLYVTVSDNYQYLKLNSELLSGKYADIKHLAELSKYIPVKWNIFEMPVKINGEVKFRCTVVGKATLFFTFAIEDIDKYIKRSEELISACRAYLRGAREKLDEMNNR